MKIVIPHFSGRVSPVFDVAEHFYLIEVENGEELSRRDLNIPGVGIFDKAKIFLQVGAEVVICGAITQVQESALSSNGIHLFPFVCGELDEVLAAFNRGELAEGACKMPGCCGRRRRHCHGNRGGKHNHN